MKTNIKNKKGFTLIELLVVVAIIGLLSSVILASLNTARFKAKDAAMKESVHQFENLMALNYQDYGSYCQLQWAWSSISGGVCLGFSGTYATQAQNICNSIYNNAGDIWGPTGAYRIYNNTSTGCATSFSFMIALNNGKWYCSGSSGAKGEYPDYNGQLGCWNNP